MTQSKLMLKDLRHIVREELSAISKRIDHVGIVKVVTGASKFLAAVEAFKESAPSSAINAVTPQIDELERVLEDMVSTPGSYISKPKIEPKKVSLKAIK